MQARRDPHRRQLIKFVHSVGHVVEAVVDFPEDAAWFELARRIALAGANSCEDFDSLLDGRNRVNVEALIRDSFNHFVAQHQIFHILGWYEDALLSGQAFDPADIVETLDFLVDAADGLHVTLLAHGACDGEVLSNGAVRECRQQCINFG